MPASGWSMPMCTGSCTVGGVIVSYFEWDAEPVGPRVVGREVEPGGVCQRPRGCDTGRSRGGARPLPPAKVHRNQGRCPRGAARPTIRSGGATWSATSSQWETIPRACSRMMPWWPSMASNDPSGGKGLHTPPVATSDTSYAFGRPATAPTASPPSHLRAPRRPNEGRRNELEEDQGHPHRRHCPDRMGHPRRHGHPRAGTKAVPVVAEDHVSLAV